MSAPHIPGRNARPDPRLMAPLLADLAGRSPDEMAQSLAFRAGFAAFAARAYWEAHECWEPVWLALPPASPARHLMRGLIQLANAGLKRRMGRAAAAARILALADAALDEARRAPLGIDAETLRGMRAQVIAETAL